MKRLVVVLLALAAGGCLGQGEGWVVGRLWVDNCKGGDPMGESFDNPADFDLHVDFFSGESMLDSTESISQRRNSLALRIQNTSNNVEASDGLLIQMIDLNLAARSFAQRLPLAISASGLCPGGNCTLVEDSLRASLYLYSTCPDGRQALSGSSYSFAPSPDDKTCLQSTSSITAPCPELTAADRQALDKLCEGDFDDKSLSADVATLLGPGACMYLCTFGKARRGQDPAQLESFSIDYGERVAAIFSTAIVDGRAINLQSCSGGAGEVQGMFDFELARGRSAQSFP